MPGHAPAIALPGATHGGIGLNPAVRTVPKVPTCTVPLSIGAYSIGLGRGGSHSTHGPASSPGWFVQSLHTRRRQTAQR